ncbi:MAG TPA: hypothetical protein VK324_10810 [Tepidisphaeraceae bacterium]|nr:hypothetical protein [Tepidisphaeraceae bacterium]
MRSLIPSVPEVMIFVGMAVLCAAGAEHMASAGNRDAGLSVLAAPLFVFAAVMGLRRNWQREAMSEQAVMIETAPADRQSPAASRDALGAE